MQMVTISAGELLMRINGKRIEYTSELYDCLKEYEPDDTLKIDLASIRLWESKEYYVLKQDLPADFIRYLSSAVLVDYVSEGGASDRAGIKVKDLITRVNGRSFNDAEEAIRLMIRGRDSSMVHYEILRNNQLIELNVKLSKFDLSFTHISIHFSALVFFVLGLFFALKRPEIYASRITAFTLILLGFCFSAIIDFSLSGSLTINIIKIIVIFLPGFFVMPVLFQSMAYFPEKIDKIIDKRWPINIHYYIGLVGYILFLNTIVFNKLNQFAELTLFLTLLLQLFVHIYLRYKFKKIIPDSYRQKNKYIKWSLIFVFSYFLILPNLIFTVLLLFVHVFNIDISSYYNSLAQNSLLKNTVFLLTLVPLAYIYTTSRYRIFNLDLRMKRNIQYNFAIAGWIIIVVVLWFIVIGKIASLDIIMPNIKFTGSSFYISNDPLASDQNRLLSRLFLIIISLGLGFVLVQVGRIGIFYLRERFYRQSLDYRRSAFEFSNLLEYSYKISDLSDNIIDRIAQLVKLKSAAIIIIEEEYRISEFATHNIDHQEFVDFIIENKSELIETINTIKGSFKNDYMPEQLKKLILSWGLLYTFPVRSKGRIVGALFIGEKLSEAQIVSEDREFINSIIIQISIAIENALLYEDLAAQERIKHELELARKIQLASLPKEVPQIIGLEISASSIPALEVGGDFFDYLPISHSEIIIVAGDVSGKGSSAALYMSQTQGIIHTLHEFKLPPDELLTRANNLLYSRIDKSSFITAIAMKFDTERKILSTSRAGHLPIFLLRDNHIIEIRSKGMAMGLVSDTFFRNNIELTEIEIRKGDIFTVVTDGVTEAQDENMNEFDVDRLKKVILESSDKSSEDIRTNIIKKVSEFCSSKDQFDDMTIVVIKVTD